MPMRWCIIVVIASIVDPPSTYAAKALYLHSIYQTTAVLVGSSLLSVYASINRYAYYSTILSYGRLVSLRPSCRKYIISII